MVKSRSRPASPSWLGEPRPRSSASAWSASSITSSEGWNGSERQVTSMSSGRHGPRARMPAEAVIA